MTVLELMRELRKHHPHRQIILSKDAEGNGFRPLDVVQTGSYAYGEVGLEEADLTPEVREQGYSEDDCLSGKPALVFWPRHDA